MKMASKLLLAAGAIAFVIAVIMSLVKVCFIATPGGWLELSLVLAVFSIAVQYICAPEEKPK
jgi:uncharacterized membrane protein